MKFGFSLLTYFLIFIFFTLNTSSTSQQHLFNKSVDAIFDAHIDEDFLLEKMKRNGSRNIEIKSEQTSDSTWQVFVIREIPNTPPRILKPFLNDWQKISYTQYWTGKTGGPYNCSYTLNVDQAGIEISGTLFIAEQNKQTLLKSDVKYSCSIPLFGKSIAQYAGKTGEQSVIDDFEYLEVHVD